MMNEEIKNGISNGIIKRLSSPFYGYFLVSWSLINWKLLYITFFISNESIVGKTGKLKIDYITDLFFSIWWKIILNDFIFPILLVLFFVWITPYFTNIIYRKDKQNEMKLKKIKLEEENKVLDLEKEKTQKQKKVMETKKEIVKDSPEILWEEEYKKLKEKKGLFSGFSFIIDAIYKYNGFVEYYGFKIPVKILSFAHTSNLIKFENQNQKISLTEKGKYFAKKYQFEN